MGFDNVNVNVSGPVQPTSTYKTKVLKGNQSFASQITEPNTKYVIKHDFVLDGDVTIPAGCILEFDGGSLSGGTVVGNETGIVGGLVKIFDINITFGGTWNVIDSYPEWFGAIGDGETDDTNAIQKTVDFIYGTSLRGGGSVVLANKVYICNGIVMKTSVNLVGCNIGQSVLKANESVDYVISIPYTSALNRIENLSVCASEIALGVDGIKIEFLNTTTGFSHPFNAFIGTIDKSTIATNLHELVFNNVSFRCLNNGIKSTKYPADSSGGRATGLFKFSKLIFFQCNTAIAGNYIDGEFDNLDISYSYRNGIDASFGNCRLTNIKLWFNGGTSSSGNVDYYSFVATANRSIFSDIEIQDSYSNGLKVSGSNNLFNNIEIHTVGISEDYAFHALKIDWGADGNKFSNLNFVNIEKLSTVLICYGSNNIFNGYNFVGYRRKANLDYFALAKKTTNLIRLDTNTNATISSILNSEDCKALTPICFSRKDVGFIVGFRISSLSDSSTIFKMNGSQLLIRKSNDKYKFAFIGQYGHDDESSEFNLDDNVDYQVFGNFNSMSTKLTFVLYKRNGDTYDYVSTYTITYAGVLNFTGNGNLELVSSASLSVKNIAVFNANIHPEIAVNANILNFYDTILCMSAGDVQPINTHYGLQVKDGDILGYPVVGYVSGSAIKIANILKYLTGIRYCMQLHIITQHVNYLEYQRAVLILKKYNNTLSSRLENETAGISAYIKGNDVYITIPQTYSIVTLYDEQNGIGWKFTEDAVPNDVVAVENKIHVGASNARSYSGLYTGFQYFDTTLNRLIIWDGTRFRNSGNGAGADVTNSGPFASKPSSNLIYVGYAYFCTDRQTAEGATNGIVIYHKGSDVWVDALGRVVS